MSEIRFIEEEESGVPEQSQTLKQSKMTEFFTKYSGGLIKNKNQVVLAQLALVIIFILLSIYLMRTETTRNTIGPPEGLEESSMIKI